MNKGELKEEIFECKMYITDLETNKNSKEINITDLIFDDNLEFEFGNYEDDDYGQLPYKDFKFFINDYSVTFYSPQYHKALKQIDQLTNNWNELEEWINFCIKSVNSSPFKKAYLFPYNEVLDKMKEIKERSNVSNNN